jgi:hypothetical protein
VAAALQKDCFGQRTIPLSWSHGVLIGLHGSEGIFFPWFLLYFTSLISCWSVAVFCYLVLSTLFLPLFFFHALPTLFTSAFPEYRLGSV